MNIIDVQKWRFFLSEDISGIDLSKYGKWMYFCGDRNLGDGICTDAIEQGVCRMVKLSTDNSDQNAVICFYAEKDDREENIKILKYMIGNGMIRRKKNGKLYNISFKLEEQSEKEMYRKNFKAYRKLSDYYDTENEKWI